VTKQAIPSDTCAAVFRQPGAHTDGGDQPAPEGDPPPVALATRAARRAAGVTAATPKTILKTVLSSITPVGPPRLGTASLLDRSWLWENVQVAA